MKLNTSLLFIAKIILFIHNLESNFYYLLYIKIIHGLERARKEGYLHINSTFFGMKYINYEVLLEENPQELFRKIEYIKVDKIQDIVKNRYNLFVREVMFNDFLTIKEYYDQFIILEE